MNNKKGVDVTGKFGATFSSLGRDFQASGRIYSNVGDAALNLIKSLGNAAQVYRQVRAKETPEERQFKIKTEREIDATIATHAASYRYKPQEFLEYTTNHKEEFLKNIPEEHYDWANEIYEKRINGYYSTVNSNKLMLDRQTQLNGFMEVSDELRNKAMIAASNGDMTGAAEYTVKWQENEEFMFNNGFMDGAKKHAREKDFTDDTIIQQHLFAAKQQFGNTEQLNTLLQKVDKSSNYTPEQKHSIKQTILSEHSSWQALNKVKSAEIIKTADFGIEAYAMGIEPQGFDFNDTYSQLKATGNVEKAEALQQAYYSRKEMTSFAKLSPGQMTEEIQNLKKSASDENDLKRIKNLERLAEVANKQIEADPLNFAIQHGVVADNGLDLTKPETFAVRKQNAAFIQEKYGLADAPVITKAETAALQKLLSAADSEQKAIYLAEINKGFGEQADQIFAAVSPENPEFAVAGKIFARDPQTAINIINGMNIATNEKAFKPSSNTELYNKLGELDEALSNFDTEDVGKIKKAVIANMTFLNKKNNLFSDGDALDSDKVNTAEDAIQQVLGGKIETLHVGDAWFSGSYKIVLPQNTDKHDFEEWIEKLDDKQVKDAYLGDKKVYAKDIIDLAKLHYDSDNKYTATINGEYVRHADGSVLILTYGGK